MRSSLSVEVRAPAPLVFALARDVARWPALLPHYMAAEPGGAGPAAFRFVAVRPLVPLVGLGLPVAWRARVETDAERLQLAFAHLGGATGGMTVRWTIEPTAAGCRVTIEHRFAPRAPAWARFIDRFFVRPIASRTLAAFRAIAEASCAAESEAGRLAYRSS